jgi:hypothetical protein
MKNIDTIFQLGNESTLDTMETHHYINNSMSPVEFELKNGFSVDYS